jgi:hypothetical protein
VKPNRKLKTLVANLAEICWEGSSLDGGELQEMLVQAGVLVDVIVDEPCEGHCRCRNADATPPWICYRLTEAWK